MARRSSNLDLVRLGLATLVLLSHSFLAVGVAEPGALGVTLGTWAVYGFFLLSGYLITASWRAEPDLIGFARRRLMRIVPGFVVAFAISVLIVAPLGGSTSLPVTLLRDLLFLHAPAMTAFTGSPSPYVNGSMWTIHWEMICYALVPLLFPVLRRRSLLIGVFALLLYFSVLWPGGPSEALQLFLAFLTGAILTTRSIRLPIPAAPPFPDISYGVYLYGWPVQKLLAWWGVSNPWTMFALALPIAAVLGYLSHLFVEAPALKLRRRRVSAVA